jgi:protoheme IX farnesyltransferase
MRSGNSTCGISTETQRHQDSGLRVLEFSLLRSIAKLTKFRIAGLSTLSAATGYVVFSHALNASIVTASLGVLFLAMGACAMNQLQDRNIDARMERTRRRPIPSGAVRPATAFVVAVLLVIGGFLVLWLVHNLAAALIGVFAVAWYNGVYTYLKRVWAFAVVPGALIGALPPVIGWTAAGGRPTDPQVLALAFFFFIWQVPHFWLLLFAFGTDYEKAGLPSLTKLFSRRQLARLTFIWMLATFVSSLLLSIYGLTYSPWISLGLIACGIWLAWEASKLLRTRLEKQSFWPAFRSINLYALCIMALLVTDAML